MYTLMRWSSPDANEPSSSTQHETLAALIADVRANDNLTEDEFYEFLRTGGFARADRCINYSES